MPARVTLLACAVAFLLSAGACSIRWPLDRPLPVGPARTGFDPDSTAAFVGVPDSVASRETSETRRVIVFMPREPMPEVPEGPPEELAGPPDSLAFAEPDTTLASLPDSIPEKVVISVERPGANQGLLRGQVLTELAESDSLVRMAQDRARSPEDRERLATVRGLIDQAQAAMERDDLDAAANLSHKARLLADELPVER